jgi:hypothetical protein
MRTSNAILAATLLLASSVAFATTHDDSKTYSATIDPPAGTMRCGFTVSGTINSPKDQDLYYGFFWRSELNLDSPFDQRHRVKVIHFSGPGTQRVTAASKDVGDDQLFQKRRSMRAQLRIWWASDGGKVLAAQEVPPLAESVWVDIPVTSAACASIKPATGLSTPAAPVYNPAPAAVKH